MQWDKIQIDRWVISLKTGLNFNKNLLIILSLIMLASLLSCKKEAKDTIQKVQEPNISIAIIDESKTMNNGYIEKDFEFLSYGMEREEVEEKLGKPHRFVGSGITMPVYNLVDGSYVILNYGVEYKSLEFATLVSKDNKSKEIL